MELIFVYNAKSGAFNKATDFAHKIVSPHTYNCGLCTITYGKFAVHKEWADFIKSLSFTTKFLYKNDFEKLFPDELTIFPVIYIKQKDKLHKLISAAEITKQKELSGLMGLITEKTKQFLPY